MCVCFFAFVCKPDNISLADDVGNSYRLKKLMISQYIGQAICAQCFFLKKFLLFSTATHFSGEPAIMQRFGYYLSLPFQKTTNYVLGDMRK